MSTIKILIVNASATIRRIIRSALYTVDFQDVVEASNYKEALEKIATSKVDFIITDWNMLEMNDLDFIKNIRENPGYSSIPILLITSRGTSYDAIEELQSRVNGYIIKPFTPQELKQKIESLLKDV